MVSKLQTKVFSADVTFDEQVMQVKGRDLESSDVTDARRLGVW